MAGGFDPIDPQRCEHYAGFASHLDRRSFDFIYWFLFALVILMLFLSSWKYSGDLEKVRILGLEPGSRGYRNRMKRCMMICSVYASVSIVAVIMEVYALMALQFCDGEDLMPLYWSTWTMMQVGSVIAILGILLAMFNSLRGNKNPPWALALGTPVLVVAGIGHAVHGAMRKRVQRVRSRSRSRRRGVSASSSRRHLEVSDLTISREQTIRADDSEKEDAEIAARFLGFTPEGSPIVKFVDDPGRIEPDHGVIIGRSDGNVIVAFRKPMTVVSAELQSPPPSPSYPSSSPVTPPPIINTTTTGAVGTNRVRIATPQRRMSEDSPV
ncbi:Transmembrane protein [Madurella fahalii]|uniref:Transmembrane protein n=1 Tax=Madurella fahalii TaxID=1157608 RepID=A0ABQ0FZZ9_9PEZI